MKNSEFCAFLRKQAEQLRSDIKGANDVEAAIARAFLHGVAMNYDDAASRIEGAALDNVGQHPAEPAKKNGSGKIATEKQVKMVRGKLNEVGLDEGFLLKRWNTDNAELLTHDDVQEVLAAIEVIKEQSEAS